MTFTGTWNVVMKTPMGDREVEMTLTEEGDELTGTMAADGQELPVQDGKLSGGRATWKADLTQPMPITLEFDCAVDGDAMEGTVKLGMFGSSSVAGTRV